jgi:hypothetical protein
MIYFSKEDYSDQENDGLRNCLLTCLKLQNDSINKDIVSTEFAELLVAKLSYYFDQLRAEIELTSEENDFDLIRNKESFDSKNLTSMLRTIQFLDQCLLHTNSEEFIDICQKAFFNFFLLTYFQEPLSDFDRTTRFRTHIQYIVEIVSVCESKRLIEVICSFLFGFGPLLLAIGGSATGPEELVEEEEEPSFSPVK